MRPVRQAVDDRHRGILREFDQRLMRHGAHHDRVDIAGQDARGVRNGFAPAELHVGVVENDGFAAELAHGDIERNARARGCLLEQHGENGALGKLRPGRIGGLERSLESMGAVEDQAKRVDIEIVYVKKMTRCHWPSERGVTL